MRFAELHVRVLAGDARAFSEAYELLARPLLGRVRSLRYAATEPDDVLQEIVDWVIFDKYLRHPERYDAGRGHVLSWLARMAENALVDRWRAHRHALDLVEPCGLAWDRVLSAAVLAVSPDDRIERAEWFAEGRRQLRVILPELVDRRFALLHYAKAPLAEKAAAIGAANLPPDRQRLAVNRRWRCIHMRIERFGTGRQ
jgi:DNA-directed RNA polymerase specialized sigma24 family protein